MKSRRICFLLLSIALYCFNNDKFVLARKKKWKDGTIGDKKDDTYVSRDNACPAKGKMKLAIMVSTHNRQEYVKLMADGLRASVGIRRIEIFVYDDASTQYGEKELRKWFTYAQRGMHNTHILILKNRLGAHRQSRRILEETLDRTDANVLIHLDSDMLFIPTWLMKVKGWMDKSDGIMSLYRSKHEFHEDIECDKKFCEKNTIGSAGTVWCRDLLESVLTLVDEEATGGFDYLYSTYLTEHKFRLLVPKDSPALHFGLFSSRNKRKLTKTQDIGGVGFKWRALDKGLAERAQAFLDGGSPDDPDEDNEPHGRKGKRARRAKKKGRRGQ